MTALGIQRVSVWLDDLAPEQGAFAHALEWAWRLGIPLRGLGATETGQAPRPSPCHSRTTDFAANGKEFTCAEDRWEACAAVCLKRGVSWGGSLWRGTWQLSVEQFLGSEELCIFGDALPPKLKACLLRRSLQRADANILICPAAWQPVVRVLVVHEQDDADNPFLDAAIRLCEAIQASPVVLTVARSEMEARRRLRVAEEVLAARGFHADFDFVAGLDTRTAVLSVARWRRCSHVFMERRQASSWWRWLRGDTMQLFFGRSNSLAFLTLPSTGLPMLDREKAGRNPAEQTPVESK